MNDVIVIGAGLLGCFVARALSAFPLETVVLDRREDVCAEVSKASTGIVYPGYDNRPGSLKARLCVKANRGFDDLCRELDVPFCRCGSLMIACGPEARARLETKLAQGKANGVPGLRLLDGKEARALEPGLPPATTAALYSPGTGVTEPWTLGIAAYENARANGVTFRFRERAIRMERVPGGFRVETDRGVYQARAVVNCAGLEADRLREMTEAPSLRLFPTAADYLVLDADGAGCPRRVLFFEPENKEKGLTLTPATDGSLLVGPTERPWNGETDFATARWGLERLRALCQEYAPVLPLDGVIRSFGSLRPNPGFVTLENGRYVRTNARIHDFPLEEADGLFSLAGIKTPGLTCARELGAETAARVAARLKCDGRNPAYSPVRKGPLRPRALSEDARAALIRQDPDYGEIVCHCRQVSKGEIRDAIRRGATTWDGVKRRTGAGMGRCQGSGCRLEVEEMLEGRTLGDFIPQTP